MKLNTYLNFDGNTAEAFEFYKSVFQTEYAAFMRFKDAPDMPGCENLSENDQNKVLHVSLPVGKDNILMASDTMEGMGSKFVQGNNFSICISTDTREQADSLFGKLSEGGQAVMPMQDMFWGDYYGMLTDKFGIQWMISFNKNQASAS